MARALLDGSKTQTRRVVKPGNLGLPGTPLRQPTPNWNTAFYGPGIWSDDADFASRCPYGQPGDRLWVRETYFAWGRWERRFSAKKGRDEWHFVDLTLEAGRDYLYAADDDMDLALPSRSGGVVQYWKRPAIFMPRAASRIDLEEFDVRVERLGDISEADARAEGARECDPVSGREVLLAGPSQRGSFVLHYRDIWEQIKGVGSWAANPWVWCVSFRRVKP